MCYSKNLIFNLQNYTIQKGEVNFCPEVSLKLLNITWNIIQCTWTYESSFRMLKLKLQYFCHLIQRTDSLVKTLMLGKIEGRKRRGQQRMRWMDGITESKPISLSKFWEKWRTEKPGVLQSMVSKVVRYDLTSEQQFKTYPLWQIRHTWHIQVRKRTKFEVPFFYYNLKKYYNNTGKAWKKTWFDNDKMVGMIN